MVEILTTLVAIAVISNPMFDFQFGHNRIVSIMSKTMAELFKTDQVTQLQLLTPNSLDKISTPTKYHNYIYIYIYRMSRKY